MAQSIFREVTGKVRSAADGLTDRCPICRAPRVSHDVLDFKNAGKYAHRVFDSLKLSECGACRSSWVAKAPTSDDLGLYYGDARNYQPSRMEALDEDRWPIWDSRPASLITIGRMLVELQPGERFVDVGPGNGAALSLAPLLLPSPELGCLEYSDRTIEFLERHIPGVAIAQSIEELTDLWGAASIGMLYSGHCFEHFSATDLNETLPLFHDALRPGGAMVIEVPFAPPARVASTSKHTPHLIYFTHDGLRSMLERHGFEIGFCAVSPGSTPNSMRWFKRTYPTPGSDEVGRAVARRIEALNSKDFVGRDPAELERRGASGVIKCVAIKPQAGALGAARRASAVQFGQSAVQGVKRLRSSVS